ncbi:hypothetical protein FQN51_000348 [Onygenales sp. PD_10]|nr:hypothetical protein FQN51_000348 [Onygenales sp. PD_10]
MIDTWDISSMMRSKIDVGFIDYEDVSNVEHVKPIQISKPDLYLWGLVDRGEDDEDIW